MTIEVETASNKDKLIDLTARLVAAYVSNNAVRAADLPMLLNTVHAALSGATIGNEETAIPLPSPVPAVNPKNSVTPDYIICLEDGKKFKSLKRHLKTSFDLTPEEYRKRWNLDPSYPMVAPNYAETRSRLARTMGLGRKSGRAR
ncbi:MucR family transcriptional regulator [Phyllobacterium zundukense]|uniref:MucR family transcriptional regulator n=1 Tax=Phyllobacterium zundukense TaxID=1867719 RepID=A0ACD4CZX4_9HYPH|nr:MucR family transcriptional regulator [Phyllobacterium zundukense]UXN59084.1 MucR family transcriptional regulator [Phyllobacterium zundukense]